MLAYVCVENGIYVPRPTYLGKFESGTKIEKASKALDRRERILPFGATKKMGLKQSVFANAMKTRWIQMSKEDQVQVPGAKKFFQLQSGAGFWFSLI